MKISIIPEDGVIYLDGQMYPVESVKELKKRFHAIQWDGEKGHAEFVQPDGDFLPNEAILTIEPFRRYINEALEQVGVPVPDPVTPLPLYAYKRRQQIAFSIARTADFGIQYSDPQTIGMLTALVALFDKGLLTGSINYKGPNGFISLTGEQVLALAAQTAQHVQKAFNAEKVVLEEITMGTIKTIEQVDAAFTREMA